MHSRRRRVDLKTEDFSGDPRSGSSARGFIGFGEVRGVMIE